MHSIKIFLVIISIFVFSGCGEKEESKEFEQQPTLNIIVPKLTANLIRGPIIDAAKEYEKKHGIKINVVTPSWSETIRAIESSLNGDIPPYDIYVVIGLWNGNFYSQNKAEPIPEHIKKKIEWDDVLSIYKNNILSWNNIAYGMPYDGDCITLYYRKDIFENPRIQERYYNKYNKKLEVPQTWEEYIETASFFNGWDWDNDGVIEYGNAGLRVKGDVSLLQFFAQAAAYSKNKETKENYFNLETMKPLINTPPFRKALKEYKRLIEVGAPGMINFSGKDVRDSFIHGEVAMAIDWADLGIYAVEQSSSIVKDKVGYAPLPGANEVYNQKTKSWDNTFNRVASISGNWTMLINKDSHYKDIAFDFAAHITSKEYSAKLVAQSGNAINPSRESHLDDQGLWMKSGFSYESAQAYLDTIKYSLNNENVLTDILIPGGDRYYAVMDKHVYDYLLGKITLETALEKIYDSWEAITNELDREKQKKFYQESLNIRR